MKQFYLDRYHRRLLMAQGAIVKASTIDEAIQKAKALFSEPEYNEDIFVERHQGDSHPQSCRNCVHYHSDGIEGQDYWWPECMREGKEHLRNLKSFPFKKQQACFEEYEKAGFS